MPAGVSWTRYLRMYGASILAMFAGAQVVHQYYLPDLSIPEIPPKPGELQTELLGFKVREDITTAIKQQQENQQKH
uniref:ubiquinol-cytochrome-c reductase complex assembly factor 6 n=1 Tax=Doryrhamphus excisus TaxID=161450 RepID=UPI0025AE98A4|nr:ubiquinol-cytochrome-c reductase complex assembly factor 6 [Doryrhamphus excisus]XP_057931303.1 ubiquinol-cytochrome-c reductase complex assembly factor 6 [Doryrhamphus excisus]